jgi:hypothetical protein
MFTDALTKLADGLAVTSTDAYTTYSYDTGNTTPKGDLGPGEPMALVYTVGVAASVSADDFHFFLIAATSADLASGTVKVLDRKVAGALLTLGAKVILPIPPLNSALRYIGGRVELGSSDTITVDCDLMPLSMAENLKTYKGGFTVS